MSFYGFETTVAFCLVGSLLRAPASRKNRNATRRESTNHLADSSMASKSCLPTICGILSCFLAISISIHVCMCQEMKTEDETREKWKKKDVRDYTDADLERLFEQWEVCSAWLDLAVADWPVGLAEV